MAKKQTPQSFWEKVSVDASHPQKCWEWLGACNSTGYGTVSVNGKVYTAHRVAAWYSGLITDINAPKHKSEKGFVLHTCDNRKCCNPTHFVIGNYSDNQKDAYTEKRKLQPKGARHANSKLTTEQVSEIRNRYTNGEYQISLAREYGVSQRCISLIVRWETYK